MKRDAFASSSVSAGGNSRSYYLGKEKEGFEEERGFVRNTR
jgi:hypothetical protein